jgi:hypothetical protein
VVFARETPGILNWCINGLSLLFKDCTESGDIGITPDQRKRVNDLLSESDSLRLFVSNEIIRDDTKMGSGESYSLTSDDIITEYIEDCLKVKQWTPVSAVTAEKRLPDLTLQYFGTSRPIA